MNQYQKFSIFLFRLIGAVVSAVGIMGPLDIGIMLDLGYDTKIYSQEQWAASITWTIFGILLIVCSKPLGRLIGDGLG